MIDFRGLAALACAALASGPAARAAEISVLVPAYFYPVPASPWETLIADAPGADITAILNPASGPGAFIDPSYTAVVNSFRSGGGSVVGYVFSSYGARPLGEVLADVDTYAAYYAIDGVFVDEMSNSGDPATIDYYAAIYAHVKAVDPDWRVVGNPGTNTLEEYLTRPAADVLVVVENFAAAYDGYVPSAWNFVYPRRHFCHLAHTQLTVAGMAEQLWLARQRNAGWIFITDDTLGNPWDTLPAYWPEMLCRIDHIGAGDLDGDGAIDIEDLATQLANYGSMDASAAEGDIDEDGDVDLADLAVLLAGFGRAC